MRIPSNPLVNLLRSRSELKVKVSAPLDGLQRHAAPGPSGAPWPPTPPLPLHPAPNTPIRNSDTTHNNTTFFFLWVRVSSFTLCSFVSLVLLSTRQKRDQDARGSCQGCGAKDLGGPGQHQRHGAGKPTQGGCLQEVSHTTSHSLSLSVSLSLSPRSCRATDPTSLSETTSNHAITFSYRFVKHCR